jgi:chaperonin GroEL
VLNVPKKKALSQVVGSRCCGIEILGQAEKVIVNKGTTTIIGGRGSKTELVERVTSIKRAMQSTENDYEKEVLADRLAKLDGGIAIIKVGACSESEAKEKFDRTEDAVLSVKCAKEEGVVPGGGIALLRAANSEELGAYTNTLSAEERVGAQLVTDAMYAPLRKILENGGYDPEMVISNLTQGSLICCDYAGTSGIPFTFASSRAVHGFNALTGYYADMLEAGIVDPAKVVRQALANAGSLAGTLLTAAGAIVNLPEGSKK